MKKALKITFGTMLVASMSAPALAHFDDIFDQSSIWVTGTYYKPSNNGLSVGDIQFAPGGTIHGNLFDGGRRAVFLEPDNDWDYAIGYRYHIPRSHSHIFISYDHYRDSEHQDNNGIRNIGLFPIGPPEFAPPFDDTEQHASVNHRVDELKLGFSHGLHFPRDRRFCMDVSAFLEYDRLTRRVHEFIIGSTEDDGRQDDQERERFTENKVHAFGPGVGAMGRIHPFYCFPRWSIFAGVSHTLFYAKNEYQQQYFMDNDEFGYEYSPEDSKSILGKLDINFGIEYCHALGPVRNSMMFDIAIGMRYMNIYNAFKNGNTAWNALGTAGGSNPDTDIEYAGFASHFGTPEDFGRFGPYIQFSLMGADG